MKLLLIAFDLFECVLPFQTGLGLAALSSTVCKSPAKSSLLYYLYIYIYMQSTTCHNRPGSGYRQLARAPASTNQQNLTSPFLKFACSLREAHWHTRTHILPHSLSVCLSLSLSVSLCLSLSPFPCVSLFLSLSLYVCVSSFLCLYVKLHLARVHIQGHTHICIHIYIYSVYMYIYI